MKKIIIGSMIGLIIIASCIFVNQERKINELEYSLQVKQQQDERHSDTTYTVLNAKKIQEKFLQIIVPLQDSIDNCKKQIKKLIEARDRLLPKLMDGEIEV